MNEEIKVANEEETEVVTEETKKEGFLSKAKTVITKHGKKVGAIALAATVGVIGYALGKKNSNEDDDVIMTFDDSDEPVDFGVDDDAE